MNAEGRDTRFIAAATPSADFAASGFVCLFHADVFAEIFIFSLSFALPPAAVVFDVFIFTYAMLSAAAIDTSCQTASFHLGHSQRH
jgi:hypothetical protein